MTPGSTPTIIIMQTDTESRPPNHREFKVALPPTAFDINDRTPFSMERHDEEQIDFPKNYARYRFVETTPLVASPSIAFSTDSLKVHMLVVATRDNFIVADEENRPGPDFFAHAVFALDGGPHDLADSRGLQTDEPGGRVADNQQKASSRAE